MVCAAPGGTLRTLGNYGVKPASRSPAGPIPVWIHFLYFSVRLLAPDPYLKEGTSLPSTSRFLPTQRSLELAGKEAAPRPTLSLPPRNQAVLQPRRNLLSDPGGSPRPGGQVRSFRVGRSEGLDTGPTAPRCLWPRRHAAPQPAWSRDWCGPTRRGGRAALGRGRHTVLRCALRSVWSPRPGDRASMSHQSPTVASLATRL